MTFGGSYFAQSYFGGLPILVENITGTGASIAAAGASSGSGALIFSGDSNPTAASATSTASGAQTFIATSGNIASAATSTASGNSVFTGTSGIAAAAATSSATGTTSGAVAPEIAGGPAMRPRPRRRRRVAISLPEIEAVHGAGSSRLSSGVSAGNGRVMLRYIGSASALGQPARTIASGYTSRGRASREKEMMDIILAIAGRN